MPEDIREYIRAAQAAEIRGDKSQAIQLLKQAAKLYESAGTRGRQLQTLRHATRLVGREEPALVPTLALASSPAAPSAPVPAIRDAAPVEFFDPSGVIPQLVAAMREGAKLVLLLGSPGSGKTACLRALEARG